MTEIKAHCKINLGLRVIRRRDDGFHDIETVMVPVRGLYDTIAVEAMPTVETFVTLTPPPYPAPLGVFPAESVLEVSGAEVDCPAEENICMRALRLMQSEYGIGEALIRLHKEVPSGAGLGGGSADAAAVLRALNREFVLELTDTELETLAARPGSDVPFFIGNEARLCTGRGEVMTPIEVDLSGLWLVIAKPAAAISTAEAYANVTPRESMPGGRRDEPPLREIVRRGVDEWRGVLENDFEQSVFQLQPEIGAIKQKLYDAGALYASMSGSGAAVFGIFEERPEGLRRRIDTPFFHTEQMR